MTRLQLTTDDLLDDLADEGYTLTRQNRTRRKPQLRKLRDVEEPDEPRRLREALED